MKAESRIVVSPGTRGKWAGGMLDQREQTSSYEINTLWAPNLHHGD